MKKTFKRSDRIAVLIKRSLAEWLQKEVHSLSSNTWVTISDVQLHDDLSMAKIYFTTLNGENNKMVDELNTHRCDFRMRLAKSMRIKKVPQLQFVYDTRVEAIKRINQLIHKAPASP